MLVRNDMDVNEHKCRYFKFYGIDISNFKE
jgi:cytidylate kinase